MDEGGKFIGCCFPSGYRLYKTNNPLLKGNYFIECRNFQKTRRNVVSAKVKIGSNIGTNYSKMTLTNGIKYCNIQKCYMMCHHTWKSTSSYDDFKRCHKTNKELEKFFQSWNETNLKRWTFIYLNEFYPVNEYTVREENHQIIQCKLSEPDYWIIDDFIQYQIFTPISIKEMQLIDDSITEKNNSNRDKFSISQEYIDLYLFRSDNINKRLDKLMLIPTLSAKIISFALIDNNDYKELSREFKNNGPFSIDDYQKKVIHDGK